MFLSALFAASIPAFAAASPFPVTSSLSPSSTSSTISSSSSSSTIYSSSTSSAPTINTPGTSTSTLSPAIYPTMTAIPTKPCGPGIPTGNRVLGMIYDRAMNGSYVPYHPSESAFGGRCDGLIVASDGQPDSTTLLANCKNITGQMKFNTLNLNRCLSSSNGTLFFSRDNSTFDTSCTDCALFHTKDRASTNLVFACGCYDDSTGGIKPASIEFGIDFPKSTTSRRFALKVQNEGVLVCSDANVTENNM